MGVRPDNDTLSTYRGQYDVDPEYDAPRRCDSKYPDDWEARRKAVLRAYDGHCGRCMNTVGPDGQGRAQIHHAKPLERNGTHALENLVSLCEDCHALIHAPNPELQGDSTNAPLFPDEDADPRVAVEREPHTDRERAIYDDQTQGTISEHPGARNGRARSPLTTEAPPSVAMQKNEMMADGAGGAVVDEGAVAGPPFGHFCNECRSRVRFGTDMCEGCQPPEDVGRTGNGRLKSAIVVLTAVTLCVGLLFAAVNAGLLVPPV